MSTILDKLSIAIILLGQADVGDLGPGLDPWG